MKKIIVGIITLFCLTFAGYYFGAYFAKKESKTSEPQNIEQVSFTSDKKEYVPDSEAPMLKDYPVKEIGQIKRAPLNLKSDPIGFEYKTRISDAYAEGPNFANHYTIAEWGCGTACQGHAIVDNLSGNIIKSEIVSSSGIDFNIDSRLIIVNKPDIVFEIYGDNVPEYAKSQYFVLSADGSRLIEIANKKNKELVSDKHENEKVVWYAVLSQFSGSGSMKFFHYDIKNKKELRDEHNPWFWAMPEIEDVDEMNKFIETVGNNQNAVFKITGTQNADDCGYYAPTAGEYVQEDYVVEGICIEDIIVENIEIVK